MATRIKATPVVRGRDADRIIEEMREGTPDTAERVATVRRADAVYRKASSKATAKKSAKTEK